jgi:hypothetical protein
MPVGAVDSGKGRRSGHFDEDPTRSHLRDDQAAVGDLGASDLFRGCLTAKRKREASTDGEDRTQRRAGEQEVNKRPPPRIARLQDSQTHDRGHSFRLNFQLRPRRSAA